MATIDEVRTRLLAYLPGAYNKEVGSTNYGLMTGYASEIKTGYDGVDALHVQVGVETATGEFLDDIGYLFRLQRNVGESDDLFRARIKSYFVANSGGGTADAIKNAVASAINISPDDVIVTDIPTLKFRVTFPVLDLGPIINTVKGVVQSAKAAGTYVYYTISYDLATEGLSLSENLTFDPDPGIIVSAYEIGSASVI
jgi:hypothetical protein